MVSKYNRKAQSEITLREGFGEDYEQLHLIITVINA